MRGKKYQAADKTVIKSGRDGLVEVKLRSRGPVSASSCKPESPVQKAEDFKKAQENREPYFAGRTERGNRGGRQRGLGKKKNTHHRKGCSGGAGALRSSEINRGKVYETSEPGTQKWEPAAEISDMQVEKPAVEISSMQVESSAALDKSKTIRGQMKQTADLCNGMGAGKDSSVSKNQPEIGTGKKAGRKNHARQSVDPDAQDGQEVRHRQDDGVMQTKIMYGNRSAACGQDSLVFRESVESGQKYAGTDDFMEDAQDADMHMDTTEDGACRYPLHDREPVFSSSYDGIQRQIYRHPARSEKIRKQSAKNQKKKAHRKKYLSQKRRQGMPAGESQAATRADTDTAYSRPDAKNDSSGNMPEQPSACPGSSRDRQDLSGVVQKEMPVLREKKRRLYFARSEQGKDEKTENTVPKKQEDKRKTAQSDKDNKAAGECVDSGMPGKNGRKRLQQETSGKKKSGRLIFEENESGMVRGAGMGIVKRAASTAFCTMEESGGIPADGCGAGDQAGMETAYRRPGYGMTGSVRRAMILAHPGSRMAPHRMRLHKNRACLRTEPERNADGKNTGKKKRQRREDDLKENPVNSTADQKKSARRRQQKRQYRRAYQAAAGKDSGFGWQAHGSAFREILKNMPYGPGKKRREHFVLGRKNNRVQWAAAALLIFFLAAVSMAASCSMLLQGTTGIIGTTYPGSDEDIRAAEAGYLALEEALDAQVRGIESTHPGYDEYRYQIDEISHNPYHLISYLTTVCPGFTYGQIEWMLPEILEGQYRLTVEERTETRTDPDTGDIYEWRILCISLTNRGLDAVAHERLTLEQEELYKAYNLTSGNRNYLFGGTDAGGGDAGEYIPGGAGVPGGAAGIPGDAMSDRRFANMIHEAEKYLGYPYVWGGSSPQTSFDCSGFVSWVVNNCGNGWSVGRQTAEGLRGCCAYVTPEEAKPGDLIFFQGTYNTSGASHVGIYVGNNRMIHCGNPIQYTDLGVYWQQHFLSYGRLP